MWCLAASKEGVPPSAHRRHTGHGPPAAPFTARAAAPQRTSAQLRRRPFRAAPRHSAPPPSAAPWRQPAEARVTSRSPSGRQRWPPRRPAARAKIASKVTPAPYDHTGTSTSVHAVRENCPKVQLANAATPLRSRPSQASGVPTLRTAVPSVSRSAPAARQSPISFLVAKCYVVSRLARLMRFLGKFILGYAICNHRVYRSSPRSYRGRRATDSPACCHICGRGNMLPRQGDLYRRRESYVKR